MQTYLFYDIETTGLNKAFDQVLHFAAIRTTLDLQELKRYELKIKLNTDVIPAPQAMITHHIGVTEALQGTPELEAIIQIHQWLNEPGTISVGYNTLGFDDEFLRFSFYRNLLPPYTHQYANQCNRMDLYPITALFYLYKNEALQWPTINGQTTLKLEQLNAANQFIEGRSHHAMVDVEITLALARQFFQHREMWDYLIGYFNKQTEEQRLQQLPFPWHVGPDSHSIGLMVDGIFGAKQAYQAPVLLLGNHNQYKNQTLWLRLDTANLHLTTEDTIAETTWVIRKKPGEPGFILPMQIRFLAHLDTERQAQLEANKMWLKENPELFSLIIAYHRAYVYPTLPNVDSEACLYLNGFLSTEENNFCRRFHQVPPPAKALLTENMLNPDLKMLAIRLLGRHYPEAMTASQLELFKEHLDRVYSDEEETTPIIDFKGNRRLNAQAALKEILEIREKLALDSEQQELLYKLESYLKERLTNSL
jgi:exodeoxyribonuclease-1